MKYIKIFLIYFLMIISILPLYGAKENLYSVIVKRANYDRMSKFVKSINELGKYCKHYIISTGDIRPTVYKVANFYNLDSNRWKSFDKISNIEIKVYNNFIKLENIFGNDKSQQLIDLFVNNPNLDPLIIVDKNNLNSIYYLFDKDELIIVDNLIKIMESSKFNNIVISQRPPNNIFYIWYKLDGAGNIDIYKFDNSHLGLNRDESWKKIGTINLIDNIRGLQKEIVVDSYEFLEKLPAIDGTRAIVSHDNYGDRYIFDQLNDKWVLVGSGGDTKGLVIDVIDNIDNLLNRKEPYYYNSEINSEITVVNMMNNNITFKKYSRFWISDRYDIPNFCSNSGTINGIVAIVDKIDELPKSTSIVPRCSIAYSMENNVNGFRGNVDYPEYIFDGNSWIDYVPNLDSLVRYGKYDRVYFVGSLKKRFKHYSLRNSVVGYWKDVDSTMVITLGSRKDMLSYSNIVDYYSYKLCQNSEWCSKDNPSEPRYSENGQLSNIYSSNSIHKFYKWYRKEDPLSVNGLIDKQ